ncbi:MAG: hypothetical protein ACMVY4_10130 [Minwuia sp.]|uniref:hypothetical protein n=1 Tax=Minwuia sp. TaxID=2493630 RepID=UPI003A88DDE7
MDENSLEDRNRLEDKVEKEFDKLKLFLALAWRENPVFVQMMIDRLSVENLTADVTRPRRQIYRTIIDYLEDALEERTDADRKRERGREGRKGYIKRFFDRGSD